jgi:ribonuclease E
MTDDQHDARPMAASSAPAQMSETLDDSPRSSLESDPGDPESPESDGTDSIGQPSLRTAAQKRRRGSRGGRNRKKPAGAGSAGIEGNGDGEVEDSDDIDDPDDENAPFADVVVPVTDDPELPKRLMEGRPSVAATEKSLVRKPQIGDTRPAPPGSAPAAIKPVQQRNRGDRQKLDKAKADPQARHEAGSAPADGQFATDVAKKKRRRGVKTGRAGGPGLEVDLDADTIERRRGRERNGRPIGRYLMAVQVRPSLTQVAVLEGRNLIEHYVSRPADDVSQIHGNIYLGKVQNVLPGMEAAFVDIGTPKNAVLYRGDVQYDPEDIVEKSGQPRIEQMLRPKQLVLCQVTKNPISAKGARLTQEVSLPGRFVVLIPNSKTYGISKRLPDDVRKRLRNILDRVKPAQHGLIVRTAAENANEHELRADMTRLLDQWNVIEAKAKRANSPTLLYREPELAVRVIREEFNPEYRGVVIDDQRLYEDVRDYVAAFNPDLADRIEYYDAVAEGLPLYERQHIHEQLHKALDRKVWLPSGGSLIIEHAEALTVIDVNTGKNVGTSNLEETVYRNNLEAAEEVAKQLRLRDIGGIVVIDFIDMEIKENRRKVVDAFRSALARDKTRTQVFDISELGLVEMTRKRIGEGLLVNFADQCPNCAGRGVIIDHALLE